MDRKQRNVWYKMTEHNPDYKIIFGKTEKEATDNTYNNMTVSLNLNASESGAHAGISFSIEDGYPEGQFNMNRTHASKGLSIEEARHLVDKLKCFISRGERFLEEYKQQ